MTRPLLYVGLDVGGTSMKCGVVDDNGAALSGVNLPTEAEQGQEHGLAQMANAIRAAAEMAGVGLDDVAGIGVATPGLMDIPGGLILDPPNLKPWKNVPVRQRIQEVFGKPTSFQNDANAAALGEFWVGAGRDARSMVLITLGTGVGGGIIIGELVVEGQHSHGGELGHMQIEMTKPRLCGCGRVGCLEAYASATSVVKRTREALAEDGGHSSLHRALRPGEELTSRLIFDAAAEGDPLAYKIVDDTAYYCAVGAKNLMHTIDPDVVAFGGGMTAAGETFIERIRHYVREVALPVPAAKTTIRYAQLGNDAGFIGAAGGARHLVRKLYGLPTG